jgi:tetratricopeptide (TPR) repeat protein
MGYCQQQRLSLLVLGLLGIGFISLAQPTVNDPRITQALREGDLAFEEFDNAAALTHYSRAVEVDSSNYEALWKLARAYVDAGLSSPKAQQMQYYFTGEKVARRCVSLHPDSTEGHFFLAVALGRAALYVGGKHKIKLAKEVKAEAERALQINPAHDGAMHVIGRWHYELSELNFIERAVAKIVFGGLPTGASYEQAITYLERAIAHNPQAPVHRLVYGRTLLKLGRTEEARAQLENCLALPDMFWDDPQHKQAARNLLDKTGKS